MSVTVRLPTLLRSHADGASTINASGATVGEVFAELATRYPGLGEQLVDGEGTLHKFVNVYRNDDDIRYLDQLGTKVTDGDTISILPAVAGGADTGTPERNRPSRTEMKRRRGRSERRASGCRVSRRPASATRQQAGTPERNRPSR
jgi:sulfur-carrier protein